MIDLLLVKFLLPSITGYRVMQSNFVIQDVVQYIPESRHSRRSRRRAWRRMTRNLWIYLLIIGVSCSVGFVAVYLPGMISKQAAPIKSLMESDGAREYYNQLPDEEKEALKRELKEKLGLGKN